MPCIAAAVDPERVIGFLQEFLHTPSQQTDRFEDEPEVKNFIAGPVASTLRSAGVDPTIDDKGNLVAGVGGGGGPALFLVSYAMTHPANTMPDPFGGEILDGNPYGYQGLVVRGRGACEQKGGLAAALGALAALKTREQDLKGRLIFACLTAGETGRHDAMKHVLDRQGITADMGIVIIGTDGKVCAGNKGRIDLLFTVEGRSSHSSTPWLGLNAIEGVRVLLNRLAEVRLTAGHPKLGMSTLTATSLKTFPDATHTVQNRARLTVDRRLMPGETVERAMEELHQAVAGMDPFRVTLERGPFMYPALVEESHPLVTSLVELSGQVTGSPPEVVYSHSALDAGYLNHVGIPTVMFGPGDMGFAHTDDEVVPVDQTVAVSRIYAVWAGHHLGL